MNPYRVNSVTRDYCGGVGTKRTKQQYLVQAVLTVLYFNIILKMHNETIAIYLQMLAKCSIYPHETNTVKTIMAN